MQLYNLPIIDCLFIRDPHGFHKSDDPDERKAHDGTLEYTSRDAHKGAHSRRGDFETLGYNLVHWAAGSLPWMTELEDPEKVEASKIAYMENVVGFLTKCFGQDTPYPPVLEEYLDYVNDMDFDSDPDYEAVRDMFEKCIAAMGKSLTGKFVWNKPKPRGRKAKKVEAEDDNSKARDNKNWNNEEKELLEEVIQFEDSFGLDWMEETRCEALNKLELGRSKRAIRKKIQRIRKKKDEEDEEKAGHGVWSEFFFERILV